MRVLTVVDERFDDYKKPSMFIGTISCGGKCCIEAELQKHPRKGIPWHPYVFPDPRPEYGEYWSPRGIGYDLSGFVQSKKAGERLLEMVKEVLGKGKPDSWLDWRESEPKWIQFKFQKNEFDLEKLDRLVVENDRIITKEILLACKL